jgi:osmotically-inducible protein OsmY
MKTDLQIQQAVMAELQREPDIDAALIGVEVEDGVVTLAGRVSSYAEKWDAERTAQRVSGVQALAVDLAVSLPGPSHRSDADIAHAAGNVLQWTTNLPKDSIKVRVEGGWVTLTGGVEWDYQRRAAEAAIRNLLGVTGLSDQIIVKPTISIGVVQAQIENAMRRRTFAGAHQIHVEVTGANVVLSGTAENWAARDLACHSAWSTPGVHHVVDNIHVTG